MMISKRLMETREIERDLNREVVVVLNVNGDEVMDGVGCWIDLNSDESRFWRWSRVDFSHDLKTVETWTDEKTRLRRLLENPPTSTVLLDTFGVTESTLIWNSPSFRATCFFYEGRDCELSKRSLKNFMVTIGWRSCWSPLQNAHICSFQPLYNNTSSVEVLSRQWIEQNRIIAVTLKWSRKRGYC